jgi:hypothetical protein
MRSLCTAAQRRADQLYMVTLAANCSNIRSASPISIIMEDWTPVSCPRVLRWSTLVIQEDLRVAKGQQRGNREAKKPKKEKPKVIAAAASPKGAWQPKDTSTSKRK